MTDGLSYCAAGVDIEAGNQLVDNIKPIAERTSRAGVMGGLGGFGALFELPTDRYEKPVLVSATDGVGTKLKLALEMGKHNTVGIDLVAMCANDLVVQGAEPLFFLDYYATGRLDIDVATSVIDGIGTGCEQAGMALIGGESAEMPGMYARGDYDLAGFCVGVVEKANIIDGSQVQAGDALIALASNGPHSNGYSLIRKVIEVSQSDLAQDFEDSTLGNTLLQPTRIYVKSLLKLLQKVPVHAMAHITGGGLTENVPRVLPKGVNAQLDASTWTRPEIFNWLQHYGEIDDEEMWHTFNCGVGMVVAVAAEDASTTIETLKNMGENAWQVGKVVESSPEAEPKVEWTA